MPKNKVILIQLWLGKIPDYFWFHYETTKNLNIDFLFVTDQDIKLDSTNYKVIKTSKDEIENKMSDILGINFNLKNNKKTCDLKASFGDLFIQYIDDYDYFGCYDIDTLFGDFDKYVSNLLGKFDFISVGDEIYCRRLSGPLILMKNTEEIRKLYQLGDFIKCFENPEVECYEENVLSNLAIQNFKVNILYNLMNCETKNGGKNTYNCYWRGGQLFINNNEKLLYHCYRKNHTIFTKVGNIITANYDKKFIDDFYWVVSFTKSYENLFINLFESIKKYSNRKCIIYSINYDFQLPTQDLGNQQFIIRRIDIPEGDKDSRGRDNNIISSKPLINLDVIKAFPNSKFVNIDTDIYLTTNSDDISKYFEELENYPLINSHIHDTIFISNVRQGEDWTNPLHVLLSAMGYNEDPVFPRRKTNIILFDDRSKWFFKRQMDLYNQYKNTEPGILYLHDEDTANAILSINKLTKSLPITDIEEVDDINMNIFFNYSYSKTEISSNAKLPQNINDVLFFHGIKTQEHYDKINSNYDLNNIESEEIVIKYSNNTILFEKNSFLANKLFNEIVDFVVYDIHGVELYRLPQQSIHNYWMFYISNINLKGKYLIKIYESTTNRCIFRDFVEIR